MNKPSIICLLFFCLLPWSLLLKASFRPERLLVAAHVVNLTASSHNTTHHAERQTTSVNLSTSWRGPTLISSINTKSKSSPNFRQNPKAVLTNIASPVKVRIWVHDPVDCLYISGFLIKRHQWESHLQQAIIKTAYQPGALFVDIGANIGVFSLVAASAGFDVVAFEPMLYNFELFEASIALNNFRNRIHVYRVAVSDDVKTGSRVCLKPAWNGNPNKNKGNGQIVQERDASATAINDTCVELKRADSIVPKCPEAVKVDVEGWEGPALRGLGIGPRCLPKIIVLEYIREYVIENPFQLLLGLKYVCRSAKSGSTIQHSTNIANGDYLCTLPRD